MKGIWKYYELSNSENFGEPLKLPYGEWPWNESIKQVFTRASADQIVRDLEEMIGKGEPGIPVYQGHPDVPELAVRYPDKGALGWIKKIEAREDAAYLFIEWDRFPGKGFGWMSPYWSGVEAIKDGKRTVTVTRLISVGLVNNPNIRDFRLPNEEAELANNERSNMKLEEILKLLGIAENAAPEEIKSKCQEFVNALEAVKSAEAKAKAACNEAQQKADEATAALENAKKELEQAKTDLENAKKETETTKTELANSKSEVEKLKALKSVSVTVQMENQKKATDDRMKLVNEIMVKEQKDFDTAWAAAKKRNPELF